MNDKNFYSAKTFHMTQCKRRVFGRFLEVVKVSELK